MPKYLIRIKHPAFRVVTDETTAASYENALRNVVFKNEEFSRMTRPQKIGFARHLIDNDMYEAADLDQTPLVEEKPKVDVKEPDSEQLALFGCLAAIKEAVDLGGDLSVYGPTGYRYEFPMANEPNGTSGGVPQHPEFYRQPMLHDPDYDGGTEVGMDNSGYKLTSNIKNVLELT